MTPPEYTIFYDPGEAGYADCEVADLEELGVFDCDNPPDYLLEGKDNTNLRLCAEHKDAAKEAGLAR